MIYVKNGFFEKFEFPGVIGCIDCSHIKIVPPPQNDPLMPAVRFVNRKGSHSIDCQIICDVNLKILHINARYPRSVHDQAIWLVSNIRQFLLNNYQNNQDRTSWLLGDSGYSLMPFLLTPIVGADPNTPNGRYTTHHVRVRNSIERCNGTLKAYFRCLKENRVLHYKPTTASKVINSCAVLYNILRERNIVDEELENEIDAIILLEDDDNDQINADEEDGNLLHEGVAVRNHLINAIFA